MSSKEAAEKLGLSHDHVRRLLEEGKLKGKKIGHSWVVFDLNYQRKRNPKRNYKGGQDDTKNQNKQS